MKSKLGQGQSGLTRRRERARTFAKLRALLRAGGGNAGWQVVDLEAWVDEWMQLPTFVNGESPAQVVRRSERWTLTEQALERMAGGVCA